MINIVKKWAESYFADEEAITLLLLIAVVLLSVIYAGHITGPIVASIIVAYLLQGMLTRFKRFMPEKFAFWLTYLFFISVCVATMVFAMPIIIKQLTSLALELPKVVLKLQAYIVELQASYPDVLSHDQLQSIIKTAAEKAASFAQAIVTFSFSSLGNVFTWMVYGILIPLMVFFLLRDKQTIFAWVGSFLPVNRPMMHRVWDDMSIQVANYSRGKAFEVFFVGISSFIAFASLGLHYAALISVAVGLSVIIPYIGATVVTLPVVLVGFFQFGYTDSFAYVMLAYGVIQFFDGNVLVPLLFSEAVNMHPLAIIIAVLVFGGLWGLWGVFFAIPLATLIKALLDSWPSARAVEELLEDE